MRSKTYVKQVARIAKFCPEAKLVKCKTHPPEVPAPRSWMQQVPKPPNEHTDLNTLIFLRSNNLGNLGRLAVFFVQTRYNFVDALQFLFPGMFLITS